MNILRVGVSHRLALGLLAIYEAYVSLNRIEDFLLLDNLPSLSCNWYSEGTNGSLESSGNGQMFDREETQKALLNFDELNRKPAVCVSNLTYKPFEREMKAILQDVAFTTTVGGLTIITGPVGSGKSTLLSAIAGEVPDQSGTVTCRGSLVYVPQIAWVFSGTIRENILFGQPYDEHKYNSVLNSCALMQDVQQFPDSDQTVVGECGAVLSGGQRARVSLARAVYADADIYLLDDPLSAVDFKVGQHIFRQCIKGLLGDKTRVLICHKEQYMKEADEVVVLDKGLVLGKGGFIELQKKNILTLTADPLCMTVLKRNESHDLVEEKREKSHFTDGRAGNEARSLRIEEEDRVIGVVSSKLYLNYLRSGAHSLVILAVVLLCIIAQGKLVLMALHHGVASHDTTVFSAIPVIYTLNMCASVFPAMAVALDVWLSYLTKEDPKSQRDPTNLTIYSCLVAGSFIFAILRGYGFLSICLRCTERLHDKMVVAILQAPVLFFDSNPVGRILNRFSKDVGCMDELLPKTFLLAITYGSMAFAYCLLPIVTNYWLLAAILPLIGITVYIGRYYLKTARQLKRLESINRSPVFSHISETLNGLDTIRTRGRQKDFLDQFYGYSFISN